MGRILLYTIIALSVVTSGCKRSDGKSSSSGVGASPVQPVPAPPPIVEGPGAGASTDGRGSPTGSRPTIKRASRQARSDYLWNLAHAALQDPSVVCSRGWQGGEKQAASVTHTYIPPGASVGNYQCRNGFGYANQPQLPGICMHPCRSLTADPRYHRPGEVLFFKSLVGLKCGSGKNEMIHDGFMVVTDNGNPEYFNIEGRFGVFWGRCKVEQNGFCLDDGAITLDFALTFSQYCRAWRPLDPLFHENIKLEMFNTVRREAIRRADNHAASFDFDDFAGLTVSSDGTIIRRFPK